MGVLDLLTEIHEFLSVLRNVFTALRLVEISAELWLNGIEKSLCLRFGRLAVLEIILVAV